MSQTKFHRDAMEIPTKPAARKKLVQWVQEHPLWNYPVHIEMEKDGKVQSKLCRVGGSFGECTCFLFVYVNPKTNRIDEDGQLNTEFRVWVEAGGWYDRSKDPQEGKYPPDGGWTDYNKWQSTNCLCLECGASDMESALLELAVRVKFHFTPKGKYRPEHERCEMKKIKDGQGGYDWISGCKPAKDGWCKKCGHAIREE